MNSVLHHHHQTSLAGNEWTLLSNILHAYDAFSTIPTINQLIERLCHTESKMDLQYSHSFDVIESIVNSVQSLMRSIPDFQVLTSDEQRSLLKRNWHGVSGLNFILVLRDTDLYNNERFITDGVGIYGNEVVARFRRLSMQLDLDSTLVKILLVIMSFSANCMITHVPKSRETDSLLLGTFRLLGSQNIFVELLWKYMVYRYGYETSIGRFVQLITHMLAVINNVVSSYMGNEFHQQFMDCTLDCSRWTISTMANAYTPLWGNTSYVY
jgi:hypothetical protein